MTWRPPPAGSARPPKGKEEWQALLTTVEQHDRFDRLRKWRNEAARKEGKPAYAILTNRQAAEAAALPEPTLAALRRVDGVGPSRIEQYGPGILRALGVAPEGGDGG